MKCYTSPSTDFLFNFATLVVENTPDLIFHSPQPQCNNINQSGNRDLSFPSSVRMTRKTIIIWWTGKLKATVLSLMSRRHPNKHTSQSLKFHEITQFGSGHPHPFPKWGGNKSRAFLRSRTFTLKYETHLTRIIYIYVDPPTKCHHLAAPFVAPQRVPF